jgi:hypothetical protein
VGVLEERFVKTNDVQIKIVEKSRQEDFVATVNEILVMGGWRVAETEMSACDNHYVAMLIRSGND